jgi:hypothetical protein
MKLQNALSIVFLAMILFIARPLAAQDRLVFSVAPDTIVYGDDFIFTCTLSGSPGSKIKAWDWCIIDWDYDHIDTLAVFHSDQGVDTCTWNGILYGSGGHIPSRTFAPLYTYVLVRAIDTNENVLCAAKDILLSSNSPCPGCLEDMLYTFPPPNTLFAHQTLTCRSIFFDDDYSGTVIDYWSWRVVLLSADGYQTIAAADSVFSHDSCRFSVTIDSVDMTKKWITSESGSILGLMNVCAMSSDSVRYNNAYIFEYYDQPTEIFKSEAAPLSFHLDQNYPNPFNPTTAISCQLPVTSKIHLDVYDVLGRKVASLVDGIKSAGDYCITWDASTFSSGVYFYRVEATPVSGNGNSFSIVKKMILMK